MSKLNRSKVIALIGAGDTLNAAVVEKAVYTVWLGQTHDEKQTADVKHLNRRGFAKKTRFWGTKIGRELQKAVNAHGLSGAAWGRIIYTKGLQEKAIVIARFHAAQVAAVWNQMNKEKAAKAA